MLAGLSFSSAILVLFAFSSLTFVSTGHIPQDATGLVRRESCSGFEGNSDLYGLGIRLGIYLQWTSSLLTNVFLPSAVSDSLDTNSIFLFAIFIAIACASTTAGGLRPAEAFIMLQLCFGYILSVLSVSGLRLAWLRDGHGPNMKALSTRFRRDPASFTPFTRGFRQYLALFNASTTSNEASTNRPGFKSVPRRTQLITKYFEQPPPDARLPRGQIFMLDFLTLLALYSHSVEVGANSSIAFTASSIIEMTLLCADLVASLWMPRSNPDGPSLSPAKQYRQRRLTQYRHIREIALGHLEPHLLAMNSTSIFKGSQASWLGIMWRSCIVAGVGSYSTWYWFTGVDSLSSDDCSSYIFIFCKTSATGPARVFFKVFSIAYLVYGGSLALACCYFVVTFFGTIYRALIISYVVMPYVKLLLYLASVNSNFARKKLDHFDDFRSGFLKWLRIPSIRELLCSFAVLSTNSAEPAGKDSPSENKKSDDQGHGSVFAPNIQARSRLTFLLHSPQH